MPSMPAPPVALVFGARNSGAAIAADRLAAGWRVLAVARGEETLERLRARLPNVETMRADAGAPGDVQAAIDRAERVLGGLDLIVNATSAVPRDQPFGGGPLAEAPDGRLEQWLSGFVPLADRILRLGARALARRGGGTLVQLTGGSARRGIPGRGAWAAAQFAVRGLVQALAQEMRPRGVHVALLVVDGTIQTDRAPLASRPPEESVHPDDVARAVAYLAAQSPRGWTHELTITPAGEAWVP
jgi:NAD(P)-dependent dehydrogenase (short-subunit alcohol dehydrogenase family)